MRITRAGYARPRKSWPLLHWACTAVLVSLTGMFISGAHDTYRWIS